MRRLSAETLLVAACCRRPGSEGREAAVSHAASRPLDWARFLRLTQRHRVEQLVQHGLLAACVEMPRPVADALAQRSAAVTRQNLVNAAEEARLYQSFRKTGMRSLFVKGTTVAILAYDSLAVKTGWDIDLLVPAASLDEATALLASLGYERRWPPASISDAQYRRWMAHSKESMWANPARRTLVDLHIGLVDNPGLLTGVGLTSPSQMVRVADGISLPTLADDELFAYLCVHGALHHWARLKWLADVAALVAREKEPERLYRASLAVGAGRCSAVALLLCHRLFGTILPTALIAELRADRGVRRLESVALYTISSCEAQEEGRESALHVFRLMAADFLLRHSWRYVLAECRKQVIFPHHLRHLGLPPWLWLPYSLLRLPGWVIKRTRLSRGWA